MTVVRWERRSLPNGAYRISGMKRLEAAPKAHGYSNCSYDGQFLDELICVKESLDLSAGVWAGLMMDMDGFTEVLALLME